MIRISRESQLIAVILFTVSIELWNTLQCPRLRDLWKQQKRMRLQDSQEIESVGHLLPRRQKFQLVQDCLEARRLRSLCLETGRIWRKLRKKERWPRGYE